MGVASKVDSVGSLVAGSSELAGIPAGDSLVAEGTVDYILEANRTELGDNWAVAPSIPAVDSRLGVLDSLADTAEEVGDIDSDTGSRHTEVEAGLDRDSQVAGDNALL